MNAADLFTDLIIAPVAGYVGTKVMEPVGMRLYEMESAEDRAREDAVRPGPPYIRSPRTGSSGCSGSVTAGLSVLLGPHELERLRREY